MDAEQYPFWKRAGFLKWGLTVWPTLVSSPWAPDLFLSLPNSETIGVGQRAGLNAFFKNGVLGFELRALCLIVRYSTTSSMP
jgi:hypothetical protein